MKLNLGCGDKKWDGFINVDLNNADVNCDIRKLPFPDESAEEIHAIHVCEHFYVLEIFGVLKDWKRVLKPGGKLCIELPCWDKIKAGIIAGVQDEAVKCAIFGDPMTHKDGEPALHKWCWGTEGMTGLLKRAGFSEIEVKTPLFHVPDRDMRIEAVK